LLPATDDDVSEIARAYAGLSKTLVSGQALVRVAEPSVKVVNRNPGRGGRATHLAAIAAPMLDAGVTLLCGASDGVDGSSQSAGAVVTSTSLRGQDINSALSRFDTGRMHQLAGTLIELPSATGLNLCDLHILAKA
jgi:glycerate 2-kinase